MAQKTAGSTTTNTNLNGSSPMDNTAPKTTVPNAIRLSEFLKGTASATGLSEEGQFYIQKIDKKLVDFKSTISSYPIATTRAEGRAFIDEQSKFAINLIFAETYGAVDSNSISEQSRDFANMLKNMRADAKLLQSIVVRKEDYAKADNMAAFIMNSINSCVKGDTLNIESLRNERFSVITRKEAVDDWTAKNSPHAVPARNDIGILLCIDVPTGTVNRFNQPEIDQQPFMAITGYTRILSPEDTGAGKFIPVAVITDVICKIPNQNLMALALSVATDAFIMQSLWSRPYASFAQKDQPNLGNLYTDPKTQQPYNIQSVDEFHRFVNESLIKPFLAVDITEGRARPVGIDAMIYQDKRGEFVSSLQAFLGNGVYGGFGPEILGRDVAVWMCRNFTGVYQENGVAKDTRWVDYLRLAPKMQNALSTIRPLLRQSNLPEGHIGEVKKIFTDGVENLYTTTTVVLDSKLAIAIATILNQAGVKLNYDTPSSSTYSVAPLMTSQANDFTGFSQMNRVMVGQYPYANQQSIYCL